MICGVDESGRGPILGPMVMAAVCIQSDDALPAGVKDSKLLTKERRESLFSELSRLKHAISIVEPNEIDVWVADKRLNYLEAKHTVDLIKQLGPRKAIIDCPSRNLEAYKHLLHKDLPGIELIVEHKADTNHPVVAAASILAKVTRDRIIEGIKEEAGFDLGSGYLTDPKTQAFLRESPLTEPFWRRSWQPYKDEQARRQQRSLL